MLQEDEIRSKMKTIIWDYDIDPYELYEIAIGKRDRVAHFDFERVMIRMLERMQWYDLLDIFGVDFFKEKLTKSLIEKIKIKEIRHKYEFAREFLQGETISVSGWSPEYRKEIRNTLLSDRWYRLEQNVSES
jgi:hypothetical protein